MAEMLVDGAKLDACNTAEADAIRAKTGGTDPIPYDYANNKGFADVIAAIPSGTTITDGIVIKARDTNGNPTDIDYYGEILPPYCFGYNSFGGVDNPMVYVQKVNWKTTLKTIKGGAFYLSKLIELTIPETVTAITMSTSSFSSNMGSLVTLNYLSSVDLDYYSFNSCTALKTARMPNLSKLKNAAGNNTGVAPFSSCTALEDVEIGSVNHTITLIHSTAFYGCTQSGLTITVFTTSTYVDTILANLRNRATNATIIIKASEATTYNGTSYAAGDTILTSEVTS